MSISHIASTNVDSLKGSLAINNVLITQHATKNLLCVSHFTKYNQVYFAFDLVGCVVNDVVMHRTLMGGTK